MKVVRETNFQLVGVKMAFMEWDRKMSQTLFITYVRPETAYVPLIGLSHVRRYIELQERESPTACDQNLVGRKRAELLGGGDELLDYRRYKIAGQVETW